MQLLKLRSFSDEENLHISIFNLRNNLIKTGDLNMIFYFWEVFVLRAHCLENS